MRLSTTIEQLNVDEQTEGERDREREIEIEEESKRVRERHNFVLCFFFVSLFSICHLIWVFFCLFMKIFRYLKLNNILYVLSLSRSLWFSFSVAPSLSRSDALSLYFLAQCVSYVSLSEFVLGWPFIQSFLLA